jgi:hypothetical protein
MYSSKIRSPEVGSQPSHSLTSFDTFPYGCEKNLVILLKRIYNPIMAMDHFICNHFSRKVYKSGSRNQVREIWIEKSGSRKMVLQTFFFWFEKSGWPEKKVGLYCKSTFFQVGEKWLTRKKIRVWRTTFLEPLFYTFLEKWLQIKWLFGFIQM